MYQVHLWPATIHWQTLSHKDVSSTPLTCHNSLTNSITWRCIKYTSDLPQFTDYHIKLYQVHLLPATIHWQTLSHKDVSSTPLTCHISLTNTIISNCIKYTSDLPQFTDKLYHIKLYQVHIWPATIHWQITIISNCIKYTSDLPQFTDKFYHIKTVSSTPLTCHNSLTNSIT